MKRIKLAITGVAVFAIQFAVMAAPNRRSDLPAKVSSAFSRQYPAGKIGSWEMSGDDYMVDFTDKKEQRSSAFYSPDGAWLRTDTRLRSNADLPDAVQNGLAKSRYDGYFIDKIERVQQPSNQTLYLLHVSYGANLEFDLHDLSANDYVLYFNNNGTLRDAIGREE